MNITTNNIDETTNIDLPGEIEDLHDENCGIEIIDDPYNQSFPCGTYQERWWDWNPATVGPDSEEPVFDEDWRDPDVWDDEDDSWSDSDSLASCGWGTDEDYGLWE